MFTKIIIIILLILGFSIAQTSLRVINMNSSIPTNLSIKGKVFKSDTNEALAGVEVALLDEVKINRSDKDMTTKTDKNGEYLFQGVKPGKYVIILSMRYENEKDLPCGKEIDRFINDGIGVTSWRDNKLYLQHAETPQFLVTSQSRTIVKNFDLSCKRKVTKRKLR